MFEPRYLDRNDVHDKQVIDRLGMEGLVLASAAYPYGTMEEQCYIMAMPGEDGTELVAVRVHWPNGHDYSCINVRELMTLEEATKRHMPASLTTTFTPHMKGDMSIYEEIGGDASNPTQLWHDGNGYNLAVLARTFDPNAEGETRKLFFVMAAHPRGAPPEWKVEIIASAGIEELREWAVSEFQSGMKP